MQTKVFWGAMLIIGVVLATAMMISVGGHSGAMTATAQEKTGAQQSAPSSSRVPAYQTDEKSLSNLPPTLEPKRFSGETRKAYQVAQEIPKTLAQLPCYCYCDEIGHKSLHSCYLSEHAAQCDRCQEEALLAYRLQKKKGLTAAQIRERIIAMYTGK